jgi:hypothetical protein
VGDHVGILSVVLFVFVTLLFSCHIRVQVELLIVAFVFGAVRVVVIAF